jgi:heme oxygenase
MTDFKNLDQSCAAFTQGCPYAQPHNVEDAEARKRTTNGCPAFNNGGCPFKNATSSEDLAKLLQSVPESHKAGGKIMGSMSALHSIMSSIHQKSKESSQKLGECPVFQSSCPFKNLTSSGTPLVAELEYRTWSVFSVEGNDKRNDDEIKEAVQLSKNLKAGTRKSHRAAENVHFVKNFIKGKIQLNIYKQMVLSLWHVYTALEDELRKNANNQIYKTLHFPEELERQQSLEEDLKYYFDDDSWKENEPSECTKSYVARIRKIGKETPELLIAHAYTRYLGDLSGGRVLMRVAKKALQLPTDGSGVAFYNFEKIQNGAKFKKAYRSLLDNISVTADVADRIVAEANVAFVMNMRIFEELDVLAGDAQSVRSLDQVMATLNMPVKKNLKCPFAVMGAPNPHLIGGSIPLKASTEDEKMTRDAKVMKKGECPWPFILLHDPMKGLQNPLTWIFILAVALFYGASFILSPAQKNYTEGK